ncbi:MAG: 2-hydroxychromene-2-carboxylate isomerase [Deltaproteobacteria bacterium]|nr:2-hydroxychromene-2-carboxylate isomerase [Deltaproteobacteria bacterium]
MPNRLVEFVYDYASPWSYLASAILDRQLPGATVAWRPVYLRGFPAFSGGLTYSPDRLRYLGQDLLRCTKYWGVPLKYPSAFPINGLQAVRAALWVLEHEPHRFPAYHEAMFRAAWAEDRDIARAEVVVGVAAEAGLDPGTIRAGLESPEIKERLKQKTRDALARGAFGVPTFFLGDEMFFGHDRMDYVRRAREAEASSSPGSSP